MRESGTETETNHAALLRDGAAAEAATNWPEAIEAYERVLSAHDESIDEAAVLTALGRCYWNMAEARTAWRTLRRAITLYKERGDGIGQAHATCEILRIWGPPERHREMALDALAALGDRDPHARALLLLRIRWFDDDPEQKFNEVMALAQQHGMDDLLAIGLEREGWKAADDGRLDDAIPLWERAHADYAAGKVYDPASGVLRMMGFSTIQAGRLDQGYEFARRGFEYASSVHLLFGAQLALIDMVGVAFARGDFAQCETLLEQSPGTADFRADFYRMWIAEERGDIDGALRLMVDPERAGRSPGAEGQVHAASAGVLYRAGRTEAARAAMEAWARVKTERDFDDYVHESPAMRECLVALASDELLHAVHNAFEKWPTVSKTPYRFSTLQGFAAAPVQGAIAAKLGHRDLAERVYRDGLAWARSERCDRDAARCEQGLAEFGLTP